MSDRATTIWGSIVIAMIIAMLGLFVYAEYCQSRAHAELIRADFVQIRENGRKAGTAGMPKEQNPYLNAQNSWQMNYESRRIEWDEGWIEGTAERE